MKSKDKNGKTYFQKFKYVCYCCYEPTANNYSTSFQLWNKPTLKTNYYPIKYGYFYFTLTFIFLKGVVVKILISFCYREMFFKSFMYCIVLYCRFNLTNNI